MGTMNNRNDMDLTEAEDIKKGWQEHTEELYKKDFHHPDSLEGYSRWGCKESDTTEGTHTQGK